MKPLLRTGIIAGLSVGLSACGTLYKLDVTAHNKSESEFEKTYVTLSGSPDLNVQSAQFEEYATQLERALAGKGYKRVGEEQLSTPPPAPVPDALVGYEQSGFATTVFTKHLSIIAVDLQKYLQEIAEVGRSVAVPREIWSIDVETTGTPSELTEVVPVMIAAASPYLGDSTGDTVRVQLSESDKRVRSIKGK